MRLAKPQLPLGISDFVRLREAGANYFYVDKTLHLAEMLRAGSYLFLARPRRFGKSLLCSTMRCLYEGRRELFQGLAIEPEWDWSKTNPVVHMSLVELGNVSTSDGLCRALVSCLSVLADRHALAIEKENPGRALVNLVTGLYEKTGRRVVVIVDEYEKPVHDHLDDPGLAKKMRDVLAAFYGTLKGCDGALERVFITGIGRMVKTSIFSELNQMTDFTLAEQAGQVCGYTESELHTVFAEPIARLAETQGLTVDETKAALRERYNGYWWGRGEKVYNPWAVLECLRAREFGSYWWSSGTPGMLVALAETMNRPDGDLEGVEASDLSLLFDITAPAAVPLLWQSGYLTVKAVSYPAYTLGFPNAEVREAWFGMMMGKFLHGETATAQTAAAVLLAALQTNDKARFERALISLFAAIPGELHIEREAFYHTVFFTALSSIGAEIIPESRTDKGRLDAVVKTRTNIYVIEFKLGAAEDALAQIKARRYYEPYLSDGRPVVLLGAGGFAEKNVRCLWEDA